MAIAAEKMAAYRATARERWAEEQKRLLLRHERAWSVARQAADLLRREYGVQRVVLFGSLVCSELFHVRSDIDLAVWGLAEKDYFRAVACLLALDVEFEIDLLPGEEIPESLAVVIDREGRTL